MRQGGIKEETRKWLYLISFMGFGLIPVAVGILVVDEQRRTSIEHQLFVGQILEVQVPDAIEIAQSSLQSVFRQILTYWGLKEKMSIKNDDSIDHQVSSQND